MTESDRRSPLEPEEFTADSDDAVPRSAMEVERPVEHLVLSASDYVNVEPLEPEKPAASLLQRRSPERTPAALGIEGYVLGNEIGRGAQGVVYRATPAQGGPEVAVKILRPEATEDEIQRFEKAIDAQGVLAGVDGIVHTLARGRTASGSPYFAMELVRGPSLRMLLDEGTLDPRELVSLLASVALAVHDAHDRGVVHRDLKLENVLIERTRDGELLPRICDFGLARDVYQGGESVTGGAGTPAYMAPEQIAGGEISRRTDVYALGALLYEMIAGMPPLKKPTTAALARAVIEEAPRPPATIWSGLPDTLGTVALRALEKDPEARYASAAAFATDIERALQGETIGGVAMRRVRPRRGLAAKVLGAAASAISRRQRFFRGLVLGLLLGTLVGFVAARAGVVGRPHAVPKNR